LSVKQTEHGQNSLTVYTWWPKFLVNSYWVRKRNFKQESNCAL